MKYIKNVMANKDCKKIIVIGLLQFIISLVILPLIVYACNSLPWADDFTNSYANFPEAVENNLKLYFFPAFRKMIYTYIYGGGYYFVTFVNFLISPFLRGGITGIRIANCCINIFFFSSAFVFFYMFTRRVLEGNLLLANVFYCAFVVVLVNAYMNSEVYTQYVVLIAYVMPVGLLFVLLSVMISEQWKGRYLVLAVLAFLLGGSPLNVAALVCGLVFIIGILEWIVFGRKFEFIISFSMAIVGSLVNVLSPGNYIRHDYTVEGYDVLDSLIHTINVVVESILTKITNIPLMAIMLFVALVILSEVRYESLKVKFNYPLLCTLTVVIGIVIVDFPVFFGVGQIFDRGIYIQDITTYILGFFWMVYIIGFFKEKAISIRQVDKWMYCVFVMGFLFVALNMHEKFECTTFYMWDSLFSGELKECVRNQEQIMNMTEKSQEKDVVVYLDEEIDNVFFDSLGSDSTYYYNYTVAGYYGKESLKVFYSESVD